jgi:hypothetical protein
MEPVLLHTRNPDRCMPHAGLPMGVRPKPLDARRTFTEYPESADELWVSALEQIL